MVFRNYKKRSGRKNTFDGYSHYILEGELYSDWKYLEFEMVRKNVKVYKEIVFLRKRYNYFGER